MRVILSGERMLVYHLSRALTSRGLEVTIVHPSRSDCEWLADRVKSTVVHGDASDPTVLTDAGAESADILLALTSRDADNLAICRLGRLRFGVSRVTALVNDPAKADIFSRLGVEDVISLTPMLAAMVERQVGFDEIVSQQPVAGGHLVMTEIHLAADAPSLGRPLSELRMPAQTLIGCVVRDNHPAIPHGEFRLRAGDRVLLLALPDDLGPAIRLLTGEEA